MADFMIITLEKRLSASLAKAIAEVRDLTEPMDEISSRMLEATRERFASETGPDGVPWKKSERARQKGGKTLQDRKFLIRSLDRRSGADFAEAGVKPGAPQQTYAAIHQFGGTIRPKKGKALSFGGRLVAKVVMPARPYLGFGPELTADISGILRRHLGAAFGEGVGG